MTIELVQAHKIGDGRCYEGKAEAYREEVIRLYSRMPAREDKHGFGLVAFRNEIDRLKAWLSEAEAVAEQMDSEPDVQVKGQVQE